MTTLRPLTADDEALLFEWRNHPEIIRLSASRKAVTKDEHHQWMLRTLKDENRLVYVIEHQASPVGIVRFDRTAPDQSQAEVGIYLLPPYLHKGIGSFALQKAILMMLQRWPNLQQVKAKVRSDNEASIGFFKKFSFQTQKTLNQSSQEDFINLEASVEDVLKIINISFYGSFVRSHQLSFKSLN